MYNNKHIKTLVKKKKAFSILLQRFSTLDIKYAPNTYSIGTKKEKESTPIIKGTKMRKRRNRSGYQAIKSMSLMSKEMMSKITARYYYQLGFFLKKLSIS